MRYHIMSSSLSLVCDARAYAMTTLAWGILQNKAAYMKLNELSNAMAGLKWGTDYLVKCHPDVNGHKLYVMQHTHIAHTWQLLYTRLWRMSNASVGGSQRLLA